MAASEAPAGQSFEFQAEVQKLLEILIHSVYSSKDVFIRELVSNASDALEKVRFAQVRGTELVEDDRELGIWIETEKDDDHAKLVISDNGIGMTEGEVRSNLGTIARSGAAAFVEALEDAKDKDDVNLIGQFGIGFYSVFMVADRVVLRTRSATPGSAAVEWESDGLSAYSVRTVEEEMPRGTRIEIHLKSDEARFADDQTLEDAIRTYSNFVSFPVHLNGEVKNRTQAIWREQPSNVTEEQYEE
ncbi:MAG: ATP-binding protein, partial [Planctomycetota bacterium]